MKPDLDFIEFRRTDYLPAFIEQAAKDFVDYFAQGRRNVSQFCGIIGNSRRWTMDSLLKELERYKTNFGSRSGNEELFNLIYDSFMKCTCQEHIDSLRGVMLEALVIASCGGSTKIGSQLGWGAKVYVREPNGRKKVIRYRCSCDPLPTGCGDRATVDIGFWNGFSASLYECKVHPKYIGCKEVKYMEEVSSTLSQLKVHHTYYFVTAAPQEEAEIRLAELKLETKTNLIPIGYQRIHQTLEPPVERLS